MSILDYNIFIEANKINHNDLINNFNDGLAYLIETKSDIISYNTTKTIQFINIDAVVVEKDKYIYTTTIERQSDIINNIKFVSSNDKIKLKIIIGKEEYNNVKNFINVACYTELFLKFIFTEKPKIDDVISITYTNYILNTTNRQMLIKAHKIKTNEHLYAYGMCCKNTIKLKSRD
jgi:hypothetical protein